VKHKQWSGRKKLKERVPIYVENMLKNHDLMSEYEQMVDHVVEAGTGSNSKMWNMNKLKVSYYHWGPFILTSEHITHSLTVFNFI